MNVIQIWQRRIWVGHSKPALRRNPARLRYDRSALILIYKDLCLSGGVALNATMNGKIVRSGMFNNMFVHPNAGDGGCALGAAFMAHRSLGAKICNKRIEHVYWGRGFSEDECKKILKAVNARYTKVSDAEIPEKVSDLLVAQKIIGWCRGRAASGACRSFSQVYPPATQGKESLQIPYRRSPA